LEAAYHPNRTAAYYFTVRESRRGLPLETVLEVAHRNGVPVIVDAAPDLKPKDMFRHHISKGVDLLAFSGGKHLGGPNNSGILAGRRDLIKLAHLQAYPFDSIGRGSKMSRETIVGLVEAVNLYRMRDDEALFRVQEERAQAIADHLSDIPGVETGVTYEYSIEEHLPMGSFAYISMEGEVNGISLRGLHRKLMDGTPAIETLYEPAFLIDDYEGKLTMSPDYMLPGDDTIVVRRIREILMEK
jgi:seryl-tRNA(Sec) selenium transferase